MKNLKNLIPIALIAVVILSGYMLISSRTGNASDYKKYISNAEKYANDGIVVKAVEEYDKALDIKQSVEVYEALGNLYIKYDEIETAIECGKKMINDFPKDVKGYEFLMELYASQEMYSEFFDLHKEFVAHKYKSDKVDELYKANMYQYEIGYISYQNVIDFSGGYWIVERDDKWGYSGASGGQAVIPCSFSDAKAFIGGTAAVKDVDGNVFYIDAEGNKIAVAPEDVNATDLGIFGNIIAVKSGKKYGYYSDSFKYLFGEYDYAGTFNNGVAPVKEGEKWFIINTRGEKISEQGYDDVILDFRDVAFASNRAFVKTENEYIMIDEKGNRVGDQSFESAKVFKGDGYAAVMKNGKWGFVNSAGEIVIESKYDDALSFSNGLAAVCQSYLWGYIDLEGNVVITPAFSNVRSFNSSGVSYIYDSDSWKQIKLLKK